MESKKKTTDKQESAKSKKNQIKQIKEKSTSTKIATKKQVAERQQKQSNDKAQKQNNNKESKKENKKNRATGLVLFVACMALVMGLFIGNTLMPAMEYVNTKNHQSNITSGIQIDMTPRQVNVDGEFTTFDEVAPKVSCCVVGINCQGDNFISVGSGVAIADNGYILTNSHVIEDSNTINILLADGTNAVAQVIWKDSGLDLAVLKCNINLPWLELATPEDVAVGEPVMAIGTPLSLQFQHSHTAGIISALNRMIAVQGSDGDVYMQNLIQHDASINPGNSGGPAITLDGKIIGINTLKISEAEGIGFAVPAWIIKPVIEHIVADGYYETAYLGIYAYDSTIAEYNGYQTSANGVIVAKIDNVGPLAQSGICVGDVITKVGDTEIQNMLDLRVALYHYKVGENVELTILRGNTEQTITTTLQKHPNAQ